MLKLCISCILISMAFATTACSPAPDNNTPKIAEDARNVLDKAKTVDATVQQNTEETKKRIDADSE